jgi:hypothetical protein
MPVRAIDRNSIKQDEDWEGNNAAFTCLLCKKVFLVSGLLHEGRRACPNPNAANQLVGYEAVKRRAALWALSGTYEASGDLSLQTRRQELPLSVKCGLVALRAFINSSSFVSLISKARSLKLP